MTGQTWWKCYIHDLLLENGASHTTQAPGISMSVPGLRDESHEKLVRVIGELRHIRVLRGETEFLKQIRNGLGSCNLQTFWMRKRGRKEVAGASLPGW